MTDIEDIEVELKKEVNNKFKDIMKFVSDEFGITKNVPLHSVFIEKNQKTETPETPKPTSDFVGETPKPEEKKEEKEEKEENKENKEINKKVNEEKVEKESEQKEEEKKEEQTDEIKDEKKE